MLFIDSIECYKTSDKKLFFDYQQAFDHELKRKAMQLSKRVFLADDDGKAINIEDFIKTDVFARYLIITDDEAAQEFKLLCEDCVTTPWDYDIPEAGCWLFLDGYWQSMEELDNMLTKLKLLKEESEAE